MDIEELREFCLSFAGATEDVKWGNDLCFSVGAKMFCVTRADDASGGVSIKCTPEKFDELIERPGVNPAAYVARYKWVHISDPDVVAPAELRGLITISYNLVRDKLPKKLRESIS